MSYAIIRLRVPLGSLEPENTFHSGEAVSMFTVKSGSSVFTSTESVIDGIETYNGWANRETWAAHLWLSNDEGLLTDAREYIADNPEIAPSSALEDFVRDLLTEDGVNPAYDQSLVMAKDVGSLWRVNWFEVAMNLVEELT